MRCPCPKCIIEVWESMPCRTMPLKGHSQPYGVPYEHKGHPITCCVYGSFLWSLCLQLPLPDYLPPCKKSNEQWSWKSRLTSMPARNSILVLTYNFLHQPLNGKQSHDHIHRQTREKQGAFKQCPLQRHAPFRHWSRGWRIRRCRVYPWIRPRGGNASVKAVRHGGWHGFPWLRWHRVWPWHCLR